MGGKFRKPHKSFVALGPTTNERRIVLPPSLPLSLSPVRKPHFSSGMPKGMGTTATECLGSAENITPAHTLRFNLSLSGVWVFIPFAACVKPMRAIVKKLSRNL